eukprot:1423901-Amphidinium_carterae.1
MAAELNGLRVRLVPASNRMFKILCQCSQPLEGAAVLYLFSFNNPPFWRISFQNCGMVWPPALLWLVLDLPEQLLQRSEQDAAHAYHAHKHLT